MLHPLVPACRREADPREDLGDLRARLLRRHAVETRGIREILLRRHLLEERRLDRDAVDDPLHGALLLQHVVAEDPRRSAVRQQQGGEHANERRLPRAVLAEDRDALAALHDERDAFERRYPASALAQPRPRRVAAEKLLAQVVSFDCEQLPAPTTRRDTTTNAPTA